MRGVQGWVKFALGSMTVVGYILGFMSQPHVAQALHGAKLIP